MYTPHMKKNTKQLITIGLRLVDLVAAYELAKKNIASLSILRSFFSKQRFKVILTQLKGLDCHYSIDSSLKNNKLLKTLISNNFILTNPLI